MKRILTRFVLGGLFALLGYVGLIIFIFSILGESVTPRTENQEIFSGQMTDYLWNYFIFSGDSMISPPQGFDDFYRPELKKALKDRAIDQIPRRDFNAAIEKRLDSMGWSDRYETIKSKAGWAIWVFILFPVVLFFLWIKLHDPVLRIFNQYKKGRLYDSLERELSEKGRELHQQTGYTNNWKTKADELETAYQALDQKFRSLYSHLKEKQEAEKEAAEKAKQETEKKKIMKEEAKKKAAALD
jgi:acyl carrier protein phosphodiesterase